VVNPISLSSRCLPSTRPSLTLTIIPLAFTRPCTFFILSGDSSDASAGSATASAASLWRLRLWGVGTARSEASLGDLPIGFDLLPRLLEALAGGSARSDSDGSLTAPPSEGGGTFLPGGFRNIIITQDLCIYAKIQILRKQHDYARSLHLRKNTDITQTI